MNNAIDMPRQADTVQLPRPTAAQQRWQDCELGALFSFDIPIYLEKGWSYEAAETCLAVDAYTPEELDTDQWLEAARALGARYAIFTATHMAGFRQWQSENWPYGLRQAKWRKGKADIVGDFIAACRRRHILPGLFVSVRYNAWWHTTHKTPVFGPGGMIYGRQADTDAYQAYLRSCEQMITELCSRYGDLVELWFDGGVMPPESGGPDVLPIFEKFQPRGVFYHSRQRADHRWAGAEDGACGDPCWATITDVMSQYDAHKDPGQRCSLLRHGDPDGKSWAPAMADAPIRNHAWFWRKDEEHLLYSPADLAAMYFASVGRNANLIIGLMPDQRGLVPDADLAVCRQFGRIIRDQFKHMLAETSAAGSIAELSLAGLGQFDKFVIREDISRGERVREFVIELLVAGESWKELCHGASIGHQRIERFSAQEAAKARLRITSAIGPPVIRCFAAYAPS